MDGQDKEVRDIWIRTFPLAVLNVTILESISRSSFTTNLQQISIAKLLLNELQTAQKFNADCLSENCSDLCDDEEPARYLQLFDDLFARIVANEQWKSELKDELIDLVRKHQEEGTVNFDGSSVVATLLKTTSAVQIKQLTITALTTDSAEALEKLVKTCSPSVPKIFHESITLLRSIFEQRHSHPKIMVFVRKFVSELKSHHDQEFLDLLPPCLVPLFVVHQLYKSVSVPQRKHLESLVLKLLNEVYNPEVLDTSRPSGCQLDEGLVSFYVTACCDEFLGLIKYSWNEGKVVFPRYPHLWVHLSSMKP